MVLAPTDYTTSEHNDTLPMCSYFMGQIRINALTCKTATITSCYVKIKYRDQEIYRWFVKEKPSLLPAREL